MGQAPTAPYSEKVISSSDATSSNLHINKIIATRADIDAGTPSLFTLHNSTLQRHYDALLCRLAGGSRFRKMTNQDTSGIWSLILGLEGYMQELSRSYDIDEAWSVLEAYYLSQEYWADCLVYIYQRPSTRTDDLRAAAPTTSAKLAIFGQKLSEVYLAGDERIDLVFVSPLRQGHAEHTLSSSIVDDEAATLMTVFVYPRGGSYQLLGKDAGSQVQPGKTFTGKAQNSARSKDDKAKHEGVPRGEKLLWLMGMLEQHPVLTFGQCPSPLTSADLESMFTLSDGSVIRKAIQKAKEAGKKEHGDTGLRKDLRSARKPLPQSTSSEPPVSLSPRTGTKRKQDEKESDQAGGADPRPQKVLTRSTAAVLSLQQASLPSAPLPPSPSSNLAPDQVVAHHGSDDSTAPRSRRSMHEEEEPYPDPPERTWIRWPYPAFK